MVSSESGPGVHAIASLGFDSQADTYEAVRPSYPPEAVDHILNQAKLQQTTDGGKFRVLDLAAGTGKFTRLLLQYPHLDVTAVEPVANMRKVFHSTLPDVPILDGTSTSIPFPDNTFHCVVVAQAFHWFDNIESLTEIHRALVPGGTLVLTWNMEDRSAEWVGVLRDLYEPYDANVPQYRKGVWKEVFGTPRAHDLFTNIQSRFFLQHMKVTKQQAWQRVLSKSYIASIPTEEQQALQAKVMAALDGHDAYFNLEEGGRRYAMQPLKTEVTWCYAK